MKVSLLVFALNEIDGLKVIMPQIKREWVDQILIVDGQSQDETVSWCKENNYEVYVQKKKGIRHAYIESMKLAIGDVVITFSPDGNSIPESIPAMINKIKEGNDMVIASRYLGSAKSEDDDLVTGFGNWLFTSTLNFLYGSQMTDVMVMLRAYRKTLFYDLDLHLDESYVLPEKLFYTVIGCEPLLSCRAAKAKVKIAEVAFDEPPRIGGTRKLQVLQWGAAYYFQFFFELFHWKDPARLEAARKNILVSEIPAEPKRKIS